MMLDLSLNFSRNRMVDGGGETIRNGSKPMNKQHDKMVDAARTKTHEEAMERFRVGNEDLTPVIQSARFGFEQGYNFAKEPFATALRALVEALENPDEFDEILEMRKAQAKALLADTPLTGE
jgi:hypothetical protein